MTISKVLSKDGMSAYERWEAPLVEEDVPEPEELVTAAQIEAIQQQAYAEGYAQGYEIGVEQGHQDGFNAGHKKLEGQLKEKLQRLVSVMTFLSQPLEDLDQAVVEQLTDMTVIIAKQIIRRELHTDPGQVIAVVREATTALPAGSRDVRIFLHPNDAELVREVFAINEEREQIWKIIEDPALTRGGCRVHSENSKIDATVEHRINQVVATLMGGERGDDTSAE
ncbi:MAG: flagellar assembly protein FliH [Gammaproteobacteria bacterium]|nr:flagellar assembly protein FliH [Gammaproteobacteria bacterium]MDH5652941.1 flagellar assembly protein FliH [Gammaproteobacteria bacterium]